MCKDEFHWQKSYKRALNRPIKLKLPRKCLLAMEDTTKLLYRREYLYVVSKPKITITRGYLKYIWK